MSAGGHADVGNDATWPLTASAGLTTAATDAAATAGVELSVAGELATITHDRPRRLNAQTPHTWTRLQAIGSTLPGSVRVVLIQATGRAFSAGLDRAMFGAGVLGAPTLADLAALDPAAGEALIKTYQAAFGWLERADLVSIAAVQGHAVGAGFQLALACDLRIAADDAVLTMAEVPLGLVPDLGGTRRLVELVGYSRAMDICLTGRGVPAAEALEMGLVSRVVAADQLADVAAAAARSILRAPRDAVIEAKALLLAASSTGQPAQEAAERAAQHRLLRTLAGPARS